MQPLTFKDTIKQHTLIVAEKQMGIIKSGYNQDAIYGTELSKEIYKALTKYNYGHQVKIEHGYEYDTPLDTMISFFKKDPTKNNFRNLPARLSNYATENERVQDYLKVLYKEGQNLNINRFFDHAATIKTASEAILGEMFSPYETAYSETQIKIIQDYIAALENPRIRLIVLPKEKSLYYVNRTLSIILLYTKPLENDLFKKYYEYETDYQPIHNL